MTAAEEMILETVSAAAAGSWKLGDLTVNRMGFGTMRLPQSGRAMDTSALPSDRETAIAVLRRAVELGVNHVDTAAFYFSRLRSANELINSALAPYPDATTWTWSTTGCSRASLRWPSMWARWPRCRPPG